MTSGVRPGFDSPDGHEPPPRGCYIKGEQMLFALRTNDTDWITRNNGTVAANGRVLFEVPTVEEITFAGVRHYRTCLTDVPRDIGNRNVVCPAVWVD